MDITTNERLANAQQKLRQAENQKTIKENQIKTNARNLEKRRVFIVGSMFCKYFPIALEFTPGKSEEENRTNFEALDKFMQALTKCFQAYQDMEDSLE